MNAVARSTRTTRKICDNLALFATASTGEVDEVDVGNVDLGRVFSACGVVNVEVTLIQNKWVISVLDVYVLIGYVIHVTVSGSGTCPGLETGTVLSIQQCHVLNPGVGDKVLHPRILANRAHGDAVSAIAPQVLHVDVGRVGLWREAVIAHVYACICDSKAVNIQGIEAICVFGQRLG